MQYTCINFIVVSRFCTALDLYTLTVLLFFS